MQNQLASATPRCTVWLFKTVDRKTLDGRSGVSERYAGKDPYIDLTPFLGDGSSVSTSKSVREPAGGFSLRFMDMAQKSWESAWSPPGLQALESVYGLVEPMDVVEIRMWGGTGALPLDRNYPIVMRGFVSEISRSETMSAEGEPASVVTITGQDYGKIWQTFQVLYLPAYAEGKGLLTSFALSELFGVAAVNAMAAGEFVRTMVEKIINPHLAGFLPGTLPLDIPKKINTGTSISVRHGTVNQSFQNMQGSVYDILKFHGDVGVWNELYTEDLEDGVHCVYRAIPALHLTAAPGGSRLIQSDAQLPAVCEVRDSAIISLSTARSDANLANFYWVNNSKFDLIDEMSRKLAGLGADNNTVSLKEYPNTAAKLYGVRPMYAETQQGGDDVKNHGSGLPNAENEARSKKQEAWIDQRRRTMAEMNRDNVVLERGTAKVKGGIMRPDGRECLKAGDYVTFVRGTMAWEAYVVQVTHEYLPFQGYTQTLTFERGEGFALRTEMEGASSSPWLVERASRTGEQKL